VVIAIVAMLVVARSGPSVLYLQIGPDHANFEKGFRAPLIVATSPVSVDVFALEIPPFRSDVVFQTDAFLPPSANITILFPEVPVVAPPDDGILLRPDSGIRRVAFLPCTVPLPFPSSSLVFALAVQRGLHVLDRGLSGSEVWIQIFQILMLVDFAVFP
jgi:hypothetical protein